MVLEVVAFVDPPCRGFKLIIPRGSPVAMGFNPQFKQSLGENITTIACLRIVIIQIGSPWAFLLINGYRLNPGPKVTKLRNQAVARTVSEEDQAIAEAAARKAAADAANEAPNREDGTEVPEIVLGCSTNGQAGTL